MFAKMTRLRLTLIALAFLLAIVALLNRTTVSVNADGATTSVIVQLRDDPAAVYKAKTEKAGGQVSAAQLQAYRDGLRAQQDQFLNDLKDKANLLGADEAFTSGEKTGARTIQFRDSASEMFTFDAVVTAYKRKGNSGTGGTAPGSAAAGQPEDPEPLLPDLTELVRFTVNPLTGQVTTQLIQ